MPAFIAAAAQLGGSFLTARSERKAENKARGYNARQAAASFKYLQGVKSQDALLGALQESELKAGQKQERAGFKGARTALDLGATGARQTIQAQGKVAAADAEQSAVSRGLLGTSTGVQALTGVQDRTTALLGGIDQQLAQAFADLGLHEGEVLGQQGQQRAMLAGQNRQNQLDLGYELANLAPMAPSAKKKKKHGLINGVWDIGDLADSLGA